MDTNNIKTIQIDTYFKKLDFQCNKLSNFLANLSASPELAALKKAAKEAQKFNSILESTVSPLQSDLKKAAEEAQKFNSILEGTVSLLEADLKKTVKNVYYDDLKPEKVSFKKNFRINKLHRIQKYFKVH